MLGTTPRRLGLTALLVLAAGGCSDRSNLAMPLRGAPSDARADRDHGDPPPDMVKLVRQLAAARGIVPLPRTPHVRGALVRLGQALAFDKILSGNRDISCMTCHLPAFATGDGKSLSVGAGGVGL